MLQEFIEVNREDVGSDLVLCGDVKEHGRYRRVQAPATTKCPDNRRLLGDSSAVVIGRFLQPATICIWTRVRRVPVKAVPPGCPAQRGAAPTASLPTTLHSPA